MSNWFRNTSMSIARQLSRSLDPKHDYEPQACYNSFCKHWQQAHDIIIKSQPQHLHDDVLGVVNHLEQLVTLLVLEAKAKELHSIASPDSCLEYLLSENLLDKLYEWGTCTGKYENAVRLEQLKLFGSLIAHYSAQVIAAEPFLRPLLKLLSGFRNELPPPNLENQLVTVLNQLCVSLMQNIRLVDLFFLTTHTHSGSQSEFIVVRLLLSSVHREGGAGSVARDALLLCAKMSAHSAPLADYMLRGNTCPVLATGLSGLYSLLPRSLPDRVYRLCPDDVNAVHKLTLFVDSLEFCDAVAQVAHPSIKKHLLDLLYQGFLVPVMGPALLQSGAAEQAAAMAYLELLLRCITTSGLLRAVLHYLIHQDYDGVRVIDVLLRRLEGSSQLSLVSLSLMETLIDLNCEDVMIELVFKYLMHGHHLMVTHRQQMTDADNYREAAMAFLTLSPICCYRPIELTKKFMTDMGLNGRRILNFNTDDELSRRVNGVNDIPMSYLVQTIKYNYGNPNETLFGNYHAYLCDARFEIVSRTLACSNWSSKYDNVSTPKRETNNNTTRESVDIHTKEQDSLISICTSGYETLKTSDTSEKEPHSLNSLNETVEENKLSDNSDAKEHDSLTSIGESSGYDSFKYRLEENEDSERTAEDMFRKTCDKRGNDLREYDGEVPLIGGWRASAETIIGPLLTSLLKKASSLLESDVCMATRVSGVLSKLVSLPTPLLCALLVAPPAALHHNVPSLFQILSKMKEQVDEMVCGVPLGENISDIVDKARVFLINREMALVNARTQSNDEAPSEPVSNNEESPLRRGETKRRSISSSLSNILNRKSSSPSQQVHTQHTVYNSSPQKRPVFTQEEYWNQSISLRAILNAVILDEWIKELAALCEEHALRLSADNYEDHAFIKTVVAL